CHGTLNARPVVDGLELLPGRTIAIKQVDGHAYSVKSLGDWYAVGQTAMAVTVALVVKKAMLLFPLASTKSGALPGSTTLEMSPRKLLTTRVPLLLAV